MDENRVEGTARNLGGKAQEGFGKVTGNARAQAEGLANQAAGAAQDLYGQAAVLPRTREAASGVEKAAAPHDRDHDRILQRLSPPTRHRMVPRPHAHTAIISQAAQHGLPRHATRERSPLKSETSSAGCGSFRTASRNWGRALHRTLATRLTVSAKPLRQLCRAGRIASAKAQTRSASNLRLSAKMRPAMGPQP